MTASTTYMYEPKCLHVCLSSHGLKLAIAESCTGGMIATKITDIPGASSFFLGSIVTYSNKSKE